MSSAQPGGMAGLLSAPRRHSIGRSRVIQGAAAPQSSSQAVVVCQVDDEADLAAQRRLPRQQQLHGQRVPRRLGQAPVVQDLVAHGCLHGDEVGGPDGRARRFVVGLGVGAGEVQGTWISGKLPTAASVKAPMMQRRMLIILYRIYQATNALGLPGSVVRPLPLNGHSLP